MRQIIQLAQEHQLPEDKLRIILEFYFEYKLDQLRSKTAVIGKVDEDYVSRLRTKLDKYTNWIQEYSLMNKFMTSIERGRSEISSISCNHNHRYINGQKMLYQNLSIMTNRECYKCLIKKWINREDDIYSDCPEVVKTYVESRLSSLI